MKLTDLISFPVVILLITGTLGGEQMAGSVVVRNMEACVAKVPEVTKHASVDMMWNDVTTQCVPSAMEIKKGGGWAQHDYGHPLLKGVKV